MITTNDENELMKRCYRSGLFSQKCNFYEDISNSNGLNPICEVCRIGYYNEKHEKKLNITISMLNKIERK